MGLISSISLYFNSILVVWSCYSISLIMYYVYINQLRTLKRKGYKLGNNIKAICRILVVIPVAVMACIRDYSVGTDTLNMRYSYLRLMDMSFMDIWDYDVTAILYTLVRGIIAKVTNGNVQIFFFLLAAATLYFILLAIEKWELRYSTSALFIFYSCYGLILFDQARQLLAVAILLYAYWYLYNGYNRKYLLLSVLAGSVHLSGLLVGLMIYAIQPKEKWSIKSILFLVALFFSLFCMEDIMNIIAPLFAGTKYAVYFQNVQESDIGAGFILTLLPSVVPVAMFSNKLDKKNRMRNTVYLTIPARLAGYYSFFISRLCQYFGSISIIALPFAMENTKPKNRFLIKTIVYGLCLVYFFAFFVWSNPAEYFPYHTIFR